MTTEERLRSLLEAAGETRPIVGMSGYVVGEDGRIWSVTSNWRGYGPRPLATHPDEYGYLRVRLRTGERVTGRQVHRLVCEAFHGPAKSRLEQVRHLNGDKLDNRAANLMWGTAKDNADDRERHGRTAKGERNGWAELTDADVMAVRHLHSKGMSTLYAAALLGVDRGTISRALSGDRWGHLPTVLPKFLAVVAAAREAAKATHSAASIVDGQSCACVVHEDLRAALVALDEEGKR